MAWMAWTPPPPPGRCGRGTPSQMRAPAGTVAVPVLAAAAATATATAVMVAAAAAASRADPAVSRADDTTALRDAAVARVVVLAKKAVHPRS